MHPASDTVGSSQRFPTNLVTFLTLVLFAILTLTLRSYIPYDETRYISVAWEMWRDHSFLLPRLNESLYTEKPPLLFWLIMLGWKLFGVNDWWPRSIPLIFALFNLLLTRKIASCLWPDKKIIQNLAPLVMISIPVWTFYSMALMFDMLVTCFVLIGFLAVIKIHKSPILAGILLGLSIGLGFLAKGPVILVYLVPVILTIKYWHPHAELLKSGDYARFLLLAVGVAAIIIALWIIPVIETLGFARVKAIFLHQTRGRMIHARSHVRPLWWYLKFLPLVVFPWFYRKHSLPRLSAILADKGLIFCLAATVPALVIFSLFSSKQLHYMLPLYPPLVLMFCYQVNETNIRLGSQFIGACFIILGLAFLISRVFIAHHLNTHWLIEIGDIWPVTSMILGILLVTNQDADAVSNTICIAITTCTVMLCLYASLLAAPRPFTPIDKFAKKLADIQNRNVPLVSNMSHSEQFEYTGRMSHPLEKVDEDNIIAWAQDHPNGYVVDRYKSSKFNGTYEISIPYRFNQVLVLMNSQQFLDFHNKKQNK